ncbi:MAG: molybdopterin-dependent oxidoreductase [Geodermatophilaceae bacterium]|nr:molybdopterin-dependent oxidoreductase [Geodermatophilaceae bacterium]
MAVFRRAGRRTNLTLLSLLVLALATGGLAFGIGSLPAASVIAVTHGALGVAVVLLIPWKSVIVRRARRRQSTHPGRVAGTMLGVLTVLCVLSGLVHALAGYRPVGPVTALQVHVATALALVPFLLGHVVSHPPQRPRRTDLSRRVLLRTAGLGAAGVGAYVALEGGSALLGLPGADRRGTGSTDIGSGAPALMPVTQWLFDTVPTLGTEHRVRVDGLDLARSELDGDDEVRAVLDCTGGWYAEQVWSGTRLDRLLGDLPTGTSIDVVSQAGYRRRFPASDAAGLLLATRAGGTLLSAGHGAPVRLVAPGRRGFWWVKWVAEVTVVDAPWWRQSPFPLQ